MRHHPDLNPELLEPKEPVPNIPAELSASLNARGTYSTIHFVVRLSPRIHRLLDKVTNGSHLTTELDVETVQAFSTYLHETIHWWQHIGSTAGLVLSLAYPAQSHQNRNHLEAVLRLAGPKKSLLAWAEDAARGGMKDTEPVLMAANTAVNNAIDAEFYKAITMHPPSTAELSKSPYFESMGHS